MFSTYSIQFSSCITCFTQTGRHTRQIRARARDRTALGRGLRRLPPRARTPALGAARRLLHRAPLFYAKRGALARGPRSRRRRRCGLFPVPGVCLQAELSYEHRRSVNKIFEGALSFQRLSPIPKLER